MASLSTLRTDLNTKIGTGISDYFTNDVKRIALNAARLEILQRYDMENFIKEEDVSFVSGVGAKPSDFLRRVGERGITVRDLFNETDDTDYTRVDIERFDNDVSYTWTEKEGDLLIYEADTVTLKLRYVKKPTDMSSDGDDSEFDTKLDNGHVLWSIYLLFFYKRDFDTAELYRRKAEEEISQGMARVDSDKGDPSLGAMERAVLYANPESRGQSIENVLIL